MLKISKNLSQELQNIDSKTDRVNFTLNYVMQLVGKEHIKRLTDEELDELLGIVNSIKSITNKTQGEECMMLHDAIIAEEANRMQKASQRGLVYKIKRKMLKFMGF